MHSSKLIEFTINKACKNKSDKLMKNRIENNNNIEERRCIFGTGNITKATFDQAVLKLIVNTASPYSFVKNSAFIEFCELMIKKNQ